MTSVFISGGKAVECVRYEPRKPGRFPALLVLHGSSGPVSSFIGNQAQYLADLGYVVYFVHYFDRTGTSYATPSLIHTHFADWMETVTGAIEHAVADPKVDSSQIGLLGVSLGGYLALAVASRDPRIVAVVSLMGGMPDYFADRTKRMPATLLLHGDADSMVPVAEAFKTERMLKSLGAKYEMKIYPNQGHRFDAFAQMDALARILKFLQSHLQPAAQAAAG
jgi:carboxymethylenebutenolidase